MKTKTLVIPANVVAELDANTIASINEAIAKFEQPIAKTKARLNTYKIKVFYRTDRTDEIEVSNDRAKLEFHLWEKTAGEQWGNNFSNNVHFEIGTKYAKAIVQFDRTELTYCPTAEVKNVSVQFINEILDLIDAAEAQTEQIDKDQLYRVACNRIYKQLVDRGY